MFSDLLIASAKHTKIETHFFVSSQATWLHVEFKNGLPTRPVLPLFCKVQVSPNLLRKVIVLVAAAIGKLRPPRKAAQCLSGGGGGQPIFPCTPPGKAM